MSFPVNHNTNRPDPIQAAGTGPIRPISLPQAPQLEGETTFKAIELMVKYQNPDNVFKTPLEVKGLKAEFQTSGNAVEADFYEVDNKKYFKFDVEWQGTVKDDKGMDVPFTFKQPVFTNVQIPQDSTPDQATVEKYLNAKQQAFQLANSYTLIQKNVTELPPGGEHKTQIDALKSHNQITFKRDPSPLPNQVSELKIYSKDVNVTPLLKAAIKTDSVKGQIFSGTADPNKKEIYLPDDACHMAKIENPSRREPSLFATDSLKQQAEAFAKIKHEITNPFGNLQNSASLNFRSEWSPLTNHPDPDVDAFNFVKDRADEGDPEMQYNAGQAFENGVGVERNIDKAIDYYYLAALQNNEDAIRRLKQINPEALDPDLSEISMGAESRSEEELSPLVEPEVKSVKGQASTKPPEVLSASAESFRATQRLDILSGGKPIAPTSPAGKIYPLFIESQVALQKRLDGDTKGKLDNIELDVEDLIKKSDEWFSQVEIEEIDKDPFEAENFNEVLDGLTRQFENLLLREKDVFLEAKYVDVLTLIQAKREEYAQRTNQG